jgi:hypothetical protein
MAQDHTLMASRFELKYIIPNRVALKVRAFIQQYLEVDEFGVGKPNLSYPVHSLYLDSDDWEIHRRTVNGDRNRYKLRLRYYNENPKTPIFFEVKRRNKDIIIKNRGAVTRQAAPKILAGYLPSREDMKSPDRVEEYVAIEEFLRLMMDVNAKPKMHVAYDREAYVNNHNNEVRVTMDRNVRGMLREDGRLLATMEEPYVCTTDEVILELKFTGRFPHWYRDLVQYFDCFQTGAAKYVESTFMHHGKKQGLHPKDMIRNMLL